MYKSEQLNELTKISEKNKSIIEKVSLDINLLEETLNKLCILSNIEIRVDSDYILSYEETNKKRRIFCTFYLNDNLTKRPLIELPVIHRVNAFNKIGLLLQEICKNQNKLELNNV